MQWIENHIRGESIWYGVSLLSAIIVILSSLADRRRHRRNDIDNVGFMPWTMITVFSVLSTVLAIAFALKSG